MDIRQDIDPTPACLTLFSLAVLWKLIQT